MRTTSAGYARVHDAGRAQKCMRREFCPATRHAIHTQAFAQDNDKLTSNVMKYVRGIIYGIYLETLRLVKH